MKKKEKKADLEQLLSKLLNDLLRMWWKPFNRDKTLHIDCYDKCKWLNYKWVHLDGWFMNEESRTLRELVSIDSWLWQFCEKEKLLIWFSFRMRAKNPDWEWRWDIEYFWQDYQYRLIETSLKNEDELEQFLLDNIKVDVESK